MNLSYILLISYAQYAVNSIIMYTMLNQEFTVSSRLHNTIPANIFLPRFELMNIHIILQMILQIIP